MAQISNVTVVKQHGKIHVKCVIDGYDVVTYSKQLCNDCLSGIYCQTKYNIFHIMLADKRVETKRV